MNESADILLVGQTPPPHHGQAVVTGMLFDNPWGELKVEKLRLAYSDSIADVGKPGIWKLLHLCSLILQTWKIVLTKRPKVIYYLPASANAVPIVRDIVYLFCVRGCFSKTIFHYHAGGLPEYLTQNKILGYFGNLVYSKADMSIDVIETEPPTGSFFASKQNAVARNGVEVPVFHRIRDEDELFQILYVGLINEGKGLRDIVETATILLGRGYKFEFKIVGEWISNEFKSEMSELITSRELTNNFIFTGSLTGDEKWQTYADADVFFFPSHYEAETFGMVLVEAMAFGLPSVTTNWRGIPLVVEGGDCSILCDVKSPHQYADALEGLLLNKSKRDSMAHAARAHYEKNYTKDRFVTSMEAVFRSVLNTGS